jgi:hypothetical protein
LNNCDTRQGFSFNQTIFLPSTLREITRQTYDVLVLKGLILNGVNACSMPETYLNMLRHHVLKDHAQTNSEQTA